MNPIPTRYSLLLEGTKLEVTDAMLAVKTPFGDVLVLTGGIGTGKTLAACFWAKREMRAGAGFMTAAELARWPRYDMAAMSRLLDAAALVVDDLGTEYADEKGNFLAVFDEFVNTRCANMRKTVITTNLTAQEFRGRYGARVTDRISECGKFVSVTGASLRSPVNQGAVEAVREVEKKAAADAKATEKRTCYKHLYGADSFAHPPCDARCPYFGFQGATKGAVRDLVKSVADSKSVKTAPPAVPDSRLPPEKDDDEVPF